MPADGPAPRTPMMGWFAALGSDLAAFNQSLVLRVPAALDPDTLDTALRAVLDRHDALRMRVADDWTIEIPPPGSVTPADCLVRFDAVGLDEAAVRSAVTEQARTARDRLAPADGRMLQAVWLDRGADRDGLLLLVANHLVVDGVTWRILVPDLAAAYAGETLAPVGTPWRHWALSLSDLAGSREPRRSWTTGTRSSATPRTRSAWTPRGTPTRPPARSPPNSTQTPPRPCSPGSPASATPRSTTCS